MMKSRVRRRRLLVDPAVQGSLLLRVALYWMLCLLSVGLISIAWMMYSDRPSSSGELLSRLVTQIVPVLAGSLLPLPLALFDCLRLSNRFAGPMFRLKRALDQVARGEEVEPLHFRSSDFWTDISESFNHVAQRTEENPKPEEEENPLSAAIASTLTDMRNGRSR